MRKISNFCGIFATLFVTTTIVLLASCSQDDDYYESDMYTLAEMGTRLGGGDPGGGGQPSPVITYVDSITEWYELCFYPDSIFNTSDFQHSPLVAVNPALYGCSYIEVDAEVTLKRENGEPVVASYLCIPAVMVNVSLSPSDSIFWGPTFEAIDNIDFEVTNVYLQPEESSLPRRYILYATGFFYKLNGEIIPCTAFIPNHIFH